MIVCEKITICLNYELKLFHIPGVSVGISEDTYGIRESETSVTVCVTISSGATAIPLTVTLETYPNRDALGSYNI